MCTNPLKGFINKNGYVCKVSRNATYVKMISGSYKSFYDKPDTKECITEYIDLPCRQCSECIMTMKREWTIRSIAEAKCHDNMIFITLTYNDENLKIVETISEENIKYYHATLDHNHWQKFMRRLRDYYKDKKLRFFMCGEYGSQSYRPHYHAIIYGIGLKDIKDLIVFNRNKHGDLIYTSEIMEYNIWQKGFVTIGNCDIASCCYIAGYVDKKFTNIKGKKFYEMTNIIPPYVKSSNKPGLGRIWFNENIDNYKSIYDYISQSLNLNEPIKVYLTEHWKKKLEDYWLKNVDFQTIVDYDDNKVNHRKMFNDIKLDMILKNTDMNKVEYLEMLENSLMLKRKRKVRETK